MSDSLWPHSLQHARLPCPSPTPEAYLNSCPLSWWCHQIILSSVVPFSCLRSFPASGYFPMRQLCASGGQSTRASASASVLPMNNQGWFPSGNQDWLVWPPWCPRDSQESSPVPQFESINSSVFSLLYGPTLTSVRDYWKNPNFDYMDLCQQVMSLLFNTLSRFVIAFLPRSKHLLISWLQSPLQWFWSPRK